MKYIPLILVCFVSFLACNKKKAVVVGNVVQNTFKTIVDSSVTANTPTDTIVALIVKEDYSKQIDSFCSSHQLHFQTFSSEIKIDYSDNNNQSFNVNAYLRIQKDSLIWISMEIYGLEIFRIKIDHKEITLLNRFAAQVKKIPFSEIEKIIGIPADFGLLQDILIGNPIRFNDSLTDIHKEAESMIYADQNQTLKVIVRYLIAKQQINSITYETLSAPLPTIATIYMSNFEGLENKESFALNRNIIIKGRIQSVINLYFKKIKINPEIPFPFNIPKHYTLSQ